MSEQLGNDVSKLRVPKASTKVILQQEESLPFYSPGDSSNLQMHVLAAGFDPQNHPSPWGVTNPHLTQ